MKKLALLAILSLCATTAMAQPNVMIISKSPTSAALKKSALWQLNQDVGFEYSIKNPSHVIIQFTIDVNAYSGTINQVKSAPIKLNCGNAVYDVTPTSLVVCQSSDDISFKTISTNKDVVSSGTFNFEVK